jgi:lipoprotein NlpI
MGQILYKESRYLDALKYFNKLLEDDASQAKYFFARGMTYFQTKTYKFAAYDLSMSLDLEPDNAEANLYLGITSYYIGNEELCCYYLNRAKNFGEMTAITYLQKYCNKTERP